MALALDASTPTAVTASVALTSTGNTMTTASFTPPAGAMLVILHGTDTDNTTLSSLAVTDSLGSHLTYTQFGQAGSTSANAQVITGWRSSQVLSSTAMTVSVTYSAVSSGATVARFLRVLVFTGADTSNQIGATSGGWPITTNISVSYTSTVANSWGWLLLADWTASGVPTVPGSESVDSSYQVAGQNTFAVIKQNSTTTTSGTSVTMSTSTPTSATKYAYVYFEVLPAGVSAPTVTTSAATLIGVSNAVGNGNVTSDGGATVTERGLVWNTSINPTTANSGYVVPGTTGAFAGSVTNLLATALYHYRAYALNSVGTSYGTDTTFTTQTPGATTETFTAAGSTTWLCPQNVTTVQVEAWGGGGAGARTTANTTGGSGGGGGGYAKRTAMAVTPGTSYSYTVGAAGTNTGTPANGGTSTFTGDNSVACTATGGTSPAANATTGGSGGTGTAGDVTATGGTGGSSGASTSGGGGGEGAGASGNGGNASGATAGSGVNVDAGDGGTGKASGSNGAGGTGSNPGGGGGGSYRQSTTSQNGGPGGVGQLKLSYTIMEPVPYHIFVMPVIVQ